MAFRSSDVPNPVRWLLLAVGYLLARVGVIDVRRAERTTDLAWPRIVTGIARMSKSAADVAMVGIALGPAAIAGVGLATPYWGLAFAVGGGVAGATISLVSQRYSGGTAAGLSRAVTTSGVIVALILLPLAAVYGVGAERLIALVGDDAAAITFGADYLRVVAVGVPLAGLNLIGSRTLVGADDAWTPMVLRAGGAVVNVALNAVLLFVLEFGVVGAAIGTVVANALVLTAFSIGFTVGRLPLLGAFPVTVSIAWPSVTGDEIRDVLTIGMPLVFTNVARRAAQFPMLAIVALFGPNVLAAYVVARRVRDLMDTPGWGFSLASSSLVGQELGTGDEGDADAYGREVLWFGTGVYVVSAALVFGFADWIGRLFVSDQSILPLVSTFIAVACVSVVFRGISGGATGPLRASGDTRWPFYGQVLGLYGFALPVALVGAVSIPVPFLEAVTPLGIGALYAALILETFVPAAVTYYRFTTGHWKTISRAYRPDSSAGD
ncbi:MATE family efflux transporter [Natrinema hispanicum]|uniref:Multidrug-efflux transporter n=1 Tax=Natrinema hispanicum TaxID=392421 RepID=A0A1G6I3V3_9EURY|nr:MATE family efflux transporter [Natrinema hispanicum]SDC00745.1 putative efflux protein, MATE family [Natrinema hispanicum]SES89226.1 putative efflux protein, MATE family [Natrinema hispanicum]